MKTFLKLAGLLTVAIGLGALMGAGVNGIFTSVTASSGYQVAGAAGTSGQCLTSNGTYFAVAANCSAPVFTGTSGYQLLPSGLILEWGTASPPTPDAPYSQSLPFTFPNACLIVVATDNGARVSGVGGSSGNPSPAGAACQSTSAIYVNSENTNNGGGGAEPLGWIAIGY